MTDLSQQLGPFVAPGLLLAFGVLALGIGAMEAKTLLGNPERTDVPCTTDAVDALARRSWIGS